MGINQEACQKSRSLSEIKSWSLILNVKKNVVIENHIFDFALRNTML
jgi:hypothetical protein